MKYRIDIADWGNSTLDDMQIPQQLIYAIAERLESIAESLDSLNCQVENLVQKR